MTISLLTLCIILVTNIVLCATTIAGFFKTVALHREVNSRLTEMISIAQDLGYQRGMSDERANQLLGNPPPV